MEGGGGEEVLNFGSFSSVSPAPSTASEQPHGTPPLTGPSF